MHGFGFEESHDERAMANAPPGRMSLDANSVIGLAHSLVDRKIAG